MLFTTKEMMTMTRLKSKIVATLVMLALLLPAAASAAPPRQSGGTTGFTSGVAGPQRQPGGDLLQTIRATAPAATYTFSTDDGSWTLGSNAQGSRTITRGQLLMQLDATDAFIWSLNDQPLGDFYLEVDTTHQAGAIDNLLGVIFRLQDTQNFYLAVISSDGQYTLGKYVDDSFTTLERWTPADAINAGRGSSNRLGLLALGNQIVLLANDQELMRVQDSSFAQGAWGLTVGSINSTGTTVAFDNAVVWLPNTTGPVQQKPRISDSGNRAAPGSTTNATSGDAAVTAATLNVRSGPSTSYPVIATLKQGDTVRIIGRNTDSSWVKIELFGRDQAWTAAAFLNLRVDLRDVPVASAPPAPAAATPTPKPAARSNVAYLVIENHIGRHITVQVNDQNFVVAGKTGDTPGRYTFELQGTGRYRVAAQLPNAGSHNFDLFVETNAGQCANRTGCIALGQTFLQTYY
jgi:hypothetical protein